MISNKASNYLAFQSLDFEHTWWKLFQKSVVPTDVECLNDCCLTPIQNLLSYFMARTPREKVQKDKQQSTKHAHKTKDRVTRTPLKAGGELSCFGRVISSCSASCHYSSIYNNTWTKQVKELSKGDMTWHDLLSFTVTPMILLIVMEYMCYKWPRYVPLIVITSRSFPHSWPITGWPKEKVQKDKQQSTKHTHKTKDRVTRTPLKAGGELKCSGRVISSCSASCTHRFNLIKIPVIGNVIRYHPSVRCDLSRIWLSSLDLLVYLLPKL
jgi:hypothetical protein